jgi:hypothetical protein
MKGTKATKKELEAALRACIDLLEDIRAGLNYPVSTAIKNLHDWHTVIRKVGGHYWRYDPVENEWRREE